MFFKNLTDKDKQYIITVYTQVGLLHEEKMEILSKKYEVTPRTIRAWAYKMEIKGDVYESRLSSQLLDARNRELDNDTEILLVTAAQNKVVANIKMLQSLEKYKELLTSMGHKTQIVIIPVKYRNPTTIGEKANKKSEDWWVDEVEPYLYYNKLYFGDSLIAADSRITPTASLPLEGYESLAFSEHLVLGHPRIHLKPIARFKNQKLRVMTTTGFCTLKHYSKSKAGDKGFIHHTYGFTIIEKKKSDTCYTPRSVKVNHDGTFTDLTYKVTPDEVIKLNECKGLILGDIHYENIDTDKMKKTYQIMNVLKPEKLILHDLFDGSTVNLHENKDLYIRRKKIREKKYEIQRELDNTLDYIKELKNSFKETSIKIIQSNHDDFLDKWINEIDWRKDLHNSEAHLKLALIQQTQDLEKYGNIFGYLVSEIEDVEYINNNQGLIIASHQVGEHGNHGVNGSKGNINSFKKLNQKMIIGHGHSPQIVDGIVMVGVSCKLYQYYNSKGMSSWGHGDAIIHLDGKVQLIIYDEDYQISNLI